MLGEVADNRFSPRVKRPASGEFTRKVLDQGRLARAVGPEQADARAGVSCSLTFSRMVLSP
jgi:hypothetical protein